MSSVLLWDIDGTLLTTARAGVFALEDAARELSGASVDLSSLRTAGLTDHDVAEAALTFADVKPTPTLIETFLRFYEARLPACLPRRPGRVLPGVRELLEYLRSCRPDVRSILLTGNTRLGARAKLMHYELDDFFGSGAYSEDGCDRLTITRKALALAAGHGVDMTKTFVIGDTPHDIQCGRTVGSRTVAIATGEYSAEELTRYDPWLVLDRLPEPAEFLRLLSIPATVSA